MKHVIAIRAGIVAAALLVTFGTPHAFAQGATANKLMFLTFSGTVQVPGATLPKGTYVFRIADPDTQRVWQVLDKSQRHVLAQFFYVRTGDRTVEEMNAAHGRPVVRFHETASGDAPAIRIVYYPTDYAGAEFLYPKGHATQVAATRQDATVATIK
jgi:hypothetical protein